MGSAWATQPEATHPQNALEVSKQHLDALAALTAPLENGCAGQRTRDLSGRLAEAAQDVARRRLGRSPDGVFGSPADQLRRLLTISPNRMAACTDEVRL